jgi:hypothetical protein
MRNALSWVLGSIATLLFVFAASTTRGQDFPQGGPGGKGKGGFGGGPGGFGGKGKGGFGGGPGGFGGGPGGFGGAGGFGKGKGGFGGGPGGFPGQGFPGQNGFQGPGPGGFPPFDSNNFNAAANSGTQNSNGQSVRIIEMEDLDTRPAVPRAGKLPKGLPDWFKKLDVNKDGQVALYEWHRGGRDIEEFREWDRNDDGFITAEEALYKQRLVQIASARSESDSDDGPAPAMKGFGKGPAGGPFGGFGGKGKGDKGKRPQ